MEKSQLDLKIQEKRFKKNLGNIDREPITNAFDSNYQELNRDEICFINDVGKVRFDESVNKKFDYAKDFSEDAFFSFLNQCRYNLKGSIEDILFSLNLAKESKNGIEITNAGVLFFAKNPQMFFPKAYITAVRYQTNDRYSIIDKKDFTGPCLLQIQESLSFVLHHISVSFKFNPMRTAARQELYNYPPIAIREALINAVTHRDYMYDGAHIYIHIYPSHIDIENPGTLYHGLTIEDLGQKSVRRNRMIANLLERAGYIERTGSGFDRMRNALLENNNPELTVVATNFFNIRFFKRIEPVKVQSLTVRGLQIYYLFMERKTMTKREIASIMHISEDTTLRDLKILLDQGLIRKEGVGKAIKYTLA